MVMDDKEKIELEKRNEDHLNYHSPSMFSDPRFSATNLSNSSMGIIPSANLMAICKGGLMGSSAPMVNSYSPTVWDHSTNSQNLGYCDMSNTSHSSMVGNRKGVAASLTSVVDMGWNQPNSMSPQSLSQFPADSGFIERAARFSSFNMVNPLQVPEFMALYSSVGGVMQEVYTGNGLKSVQKNDPNLGETSKSVSAPLEQGATEANSSKNDVARRVVGGSGNESDEAEISGGGDDQDEPSLSEAADKEPYAKEISLKKRKRGAQDAELDQTKDKTETQRKAGPCPTSAGNRTTRKQTKRGYQASDSPKDEYIHVRARRGQATNSHSLAERVRREKISERMKYLQDLVPSCSKVTGKAVMLDEIINYLQSLQRQVEFLSMKVATVNPRLDFTIENLLPKDILHSRTEHSSVGFTPNLTMAYSPLHSSHPVLNQASVVGMGSYRRNISPQMASMSTGSREPSQPQQPHMWEDELHNVVHMNFAASSNQDIDVSADREKSKAELQ